MTTKNCISSDLYTSEAAASRKQSQSEVAVPDPSAEDALAAIAANTVGSLDSKPHDCTCQYPQVRVRNGYGHPQSCATYARLVRERTQRPGTR